MNYDLTICTVSTDETEHIKLNIALTKLLNKETSPRWIIVENKMHNSNRLNNNHNNIIVIKGLDENIKTEIGAPNLEHGIALNRSLQNIKTRFVLIIDPDFFIVYPNWIEKIILHMKQNNISLLGPPWHPKWNNKFRYFPCLHCLFIDSNKVDLEKIDFRPTNISRDLSKESQDIRNFSRSNLLKSMIKSTINSRGISFIRDMTTRRKENCWDGDNSSKIYMRYHNNKSHNFECFTPVFIPSIDWRIPINYKLNSFIENFLPERYCYLPKKKHYFTDKGFLNKKTQHIAWEEFLWLGSPFGFHVRGHPIKAERNKMKEVKVIKRNLENLLKTKLI